SVVIDQQVAAVSAEAACAGDVEWTAGQAGHGGLQGRFGGAVGTAAAYPAASNGDDAAVAAGLRTEQVEVVREGDLPHNRRRRSNTRPFQVKLEALRTDAENAARDRRRLRGRVLKGQGGREIYRVTIARCGEIGKVDLTRHAPVGREQQ